MSDRDSIDRFNNDVNQILETGAFTDFREPAANEYARSLAVVKMLSTIDFSEESEIRYTLRQRLLAKVDTQEGWSTKVKENNRMNTLFKRYRLQHVLSVIILASFLGLLFANLIWPGSVAAAAQSAVSFVQRIWIGEYTSIVPITPEQIIQMEDGSLAMQGDRLSEKDTVETNSRYSSGGVTFNIRRFDNLAESQVLLPFEVVQPGYLPKAYVFDSVKVFGEGNLASAHIHYAGPGGELLLSLRQVGDQNVSIGLPEDYVIEPVLVNGLPATWSEHVLMWEAGGLSCLLSSPTLDKAEAIRIAESIK